MAWCALSLWGNTKKGCDCSGFVSQVYKAVYGKSLERNSAAIRDKNCSKSDVANWEPEILFFSRRVRREKSTMWASTLKIINLSMPLQARGLLSAVWKRSIILEHMCVPDAWINPLGMEFCFSRIINQCVPPLFVNLSWNNDGVCVKVVRQVWKLVVVPTGENSISQPLSVCRFYCEACDNFRQQKRSFYHWSMRMDMKNGCHRSLDCHGRIRWSQNDASLKIYLHWQ